MIWRTFDDARVLAATEQVKDDLKGLPPGTWLLNIDNIALRNEHGDVALFEWRQTGVYCGHYFFASRGREAVEAGEDFLRYVFENTPIQVIIGFTPLDKKGAIWMSQRLGFHDHGDEDIDGRMHKIFVMTKQDYTNESNLAEVRQ